jgi:hypothetical protein
MASEQTAPAVRGIHRKMLRLMERVGGIGKNREVSGFGANYKYRGIDDLYAELHPALREVGIAMYPMMDASTLKSERVEGTRGNGKSFVQTTVTFSLNVLFVDADDGSIMTVTVPAQGIDDSDKAAGKAMSYGMKSALFHALAIPTEDPDADRPQPLTSQEQGAATTEKAKRGPGRPKKSGQPETSIADVAEQPPAVTQTKPSDIETLKAEVKATKTPEELTALIGTKLRALPNDQQLEVAKVCKEHRTAQGWK